MFKCYNLVEHVANMSKDDSKIKRHRLPNE